MMNVHELNEKDYHSIGMNDECTWIGWKRLSLYLNEWWMYLNWMHSFPLVAQALNGGDVPAVTTQDGSNTLLKD